MASIKLNYIDTSSKSTH